MSSPFPKESRHSTLLWLVLLFILGGVGGYLWSLRPADLDAADSQETAAGTVQRSASETADTEPLLDKWPKPAVALVISGEMHGYIEPCGCTGGQTGGLARRATLIEQLRKQRGWQVIGVDLGGTMIASRIGRRQTRMKFDHTRQALARMGYSSLSLGYEEALLRQDELLTISDEDKQRKNFPLRFLSANVDPYPGAGLQIVERYRIIEVPPAQPGGRPFKVAVTSVLGSTRSQGIYSDDFFKIHPVAESLTQVLAEMQAQRPDLMVLLSYSTEKESRQLVQQFPQFHVVVSTGGPEDGMLEMKTVGRSGFIQVGQKGKNVGVLGVYPGKTAPFRFELVKLDGERFPNHPTIEKLMFAYQERLRVERPDLEDNADAPAHPSGRTFVGAEKCSECHDQAYEKWSSTGHAKAFASLSTGRSAHQGKWIDRKWDAECIACHAVGWEPQKAHRWQSGFIDEAKTPHLLGNQCENCHGPGSRHVALEEESDSDAEIEAERKRMWISKADAEFKVCRQCHDGDNDPHFDMKTYWPKIAHPED